MTAFFFLCEKTCFQRLWTIVGFSNCGGGTESAMDTTAMLVHRLQYLYTESHDILPKPSG